MAFASLNKKDTRFGWTVAMVGNLTASNELIQKSLNKAYEIDRKMFMPVHVVCLEQHQNPFIHESDIYTM